MKTRTSLALLGLVAFASAQTVQVARSYKVGDVDAYHIQMKMEGSMAMTMLMDSSQKVTAVYDNGDADVETTMTNGKIALMGMDRALPTGPAQKMRISKYGNPVGATPSGRGASMDFTKYMRGLPKSGMTVGQSLDYDETDPDTKTRTKGTTKLESLTDGVAKYVTSVDVSNEKSPKPMHMEFTSLVEAATGRPNHIDGKITNLDGMPGAAAGMPITSVTLTMDRKV